MSYNADEQREIDEAIRAGKRALTSLEDAKRALGAASTLGFVDILGGGPFVSYFKHNRLGKAGIALEQARADLMLFAREIEDVRAIQDLYLDISGMEAAFDIFLDNSFMDIFVQMKIERIRQRVNSAITATESILSRLRLSS